MGTNMDKLCRKLGCTFSNLDTCSICGKPVVRIQHNLRAHERHCEELGTLNMGGVETIKLTCTGDFHPFVSLPRRG